MSIRGRCDQVAFDRAAVLLAAGYAPGRAAEMTGLPLGMVTSMTGGDGLEPVSGRFAEAFTVAYRDQLSAARAGPSAARLRRRVPEPARAKLAPKRCGRPGCDRPHRAKGLCAPCYQSARQAVAGGRGAEGERVAL